MFSRRLMAHMFCPGGAGYKYHINLFFYLCPTKLLDALISLNHPKNQPSLGLSAFCPFKEPKQLGGFAPNITKSLVQLNCIASFWRCGDKIACPLRHVDSNTQVFRFFFILVANPCYSRCCDTGVWQSSTRG